MGKVNKRGKAKQASPKDRAKLTAEESLKRLEDFDKRKEQFVATVRKSQDRGVSA